MVDSKPEELPPPFTLKIPRTGKELAITQPASSQKFTGEIGGTVITWKGSYPEAGGTTMVDPVEATLDGKLIKGSRHCQWSDGFHGCSGTTRFFGTRQ